MPLIMVDTSVSLPATLSPRGMTRKFWVVLAYGALTYEIEHRERELQELELAAQHGGRVGGFANARVRLDTARERHAALHELLPYETPDDWCTVGAGVLFAEYERKLHAIGRKLNPALRDEDIPVLVRQLQAICVAAAPPPDVRSSAPALTLDPEDDPIVYAALTADVDLLISDDRHIVPDRTSHDYKHGEHSVTAVTFSTLAHSHLTLDWDEIDGAWLADAHAL
jgi:predicted nucleic acid-binding protein